MDVQELVQWYNDVMKTGDPRTKNWPLLVSPWPTLGLTLGYLCVVFFIKSYMKDKEPFKLNKVICFYNLCIMLLNAFIAKELIITAYYEGMWTRLCNPVNHDPDNEYSYRMAFACYLYYVSKCIEFLDTIFFVLRKKNNQVSFLHLYHHSTMFPLWFTGARWAPGGSSFFSATLNSLVHVLMYFYYFVTALGVDKKWVWWKIHMTKIQLLQFFLVMGHTVLGLLLVRADECDFYEWMAWALFGYMVSMITLFSLFYYRTYVAAAKKKADKAKAEKAK